MGKLGSCGKPQYGNVLLAHMASPFSSGMVAKRGTESIHVVAESTVEVSQVWPQVSYATQFKIKCPSSF